LTGRAIEVGGAKVWLLEEGKGTPLLYLHGFADVHGVTESWTPFHEKLFAGARVIAPAHPGCAESEENEEIESIEDLVFHYLEVIDALGLERFHLAGACVGGWIAAEITVRHPEKVLGLILIGATGLFVPGSPIGDIFMMAQPERGMSHGGLREMLFESADHPLALEWFPDGRGAIEDELRRYQMLRFTSQFGFKPPYLYDRKLRDRLHRITSPTAVIWGERDRMVPVAHAQAYAQGIPTTRGVEIVQGAGHSVCIEKPDPTARLVLRFLHKDGANRD
jgi:pimeloyl-ACP methyl ester carboxylesterase